MCLFPIRLKRKLLSGEESFIDVPCGKCKLCLQSKKDELVLKMLLESYTANNVYFGTLTLNNLFYDLFCDSKVFQIYALKKFFANLRHCFSFRYFLTSELGSKTKRLHYHFIIFDYSDRPYNELYDFIKKFWHYGDRIQFGKSNVGAMNYITKYVLKQSAPLRLMSSRPPLGIDYLLNNPNLLYKFFINQKIYVEQRQYAFPKCYSDFFLRNRIQLIEKSDTPGELRRVLEDIDCYISNDKYDYSGIRRQQRFGLYEISEIPIVHCYSPIKTKSLTYDQKRKISSFNALDYERIFNDRL